MSKKVLSAAVLIGALSVKSLLRVEGEDSDQTEFIPRLVRVSAGYICYFHLVIYYSNTYMLFCQLSIEG